jgi:hypothetical protein
MAKSTKTAFTEGQTVFARVKINGTVVMIPATITAVNTSDEKGVRTTYTLEFADSTGNPSVLEGALLPR